MIIIDASALLDALLYEQCYEQFQILTAGQRVLSPEHLDIECLSGLKRSERLGVITSQTAVQLIAILQQLPIARVPVLARVMEIWSLRQNLSLYDAAYVELALANQALLITHDARLASAAEALVTIARLNNPAP